MDIATKPTAKKRKATCTVNLEPSNYAQRVTQQSCPGKSETASTAKSKHKDAKTTGRLSSIAMHHIY